MIGIKVGDVLALDTRKVVPQITSLVPHSIWSGQPLDLNSSTFPVRHGILDQRDTHGVGRVVTYMHGESIPGPVEEARMLDGL
jgi:hypothetical protein